MKGKSQKFSVSFPLPLLEAMDTHIGSTPRSRYLQDVVTAKLRSEGALAEDPIVRELNRARELIEARGLDAVRSKLDELTDLALVAEGAGK